MVNKMAQACGLKLAVLYEKYKMETDFRFAAHAVLLSDSSISTQKTFSVERGGARGGGREGHRNTSSALSYNWASGSEPT